MVSGIGRASMRLGACCNGIGQASIRFGACCIGMARQACASAPAVMIWAGKHTRRRVLRVRRDLAHTHGARDVCTGGAHHAACTMATQPVAGRVPPSPCLSFLQTRTLCVSFAVSVSLTKGPPTFASNILIIHAARVRAQKAATHHLVPRLSWQQQRKPQRTTWCSD